MSTTEADFKTGSTNSVLLGLLQGSQTEIPNTGNSAFVDDVAQIHVSVLEPKVKGNQAFLVNSDGKNGMVWEDAIAHVKESFPQAITSGHFKTTGKQPTLPLYVDASKTEETFGIKLANFEHQVKSLVSQYLDVVKA